MESSQPALEVVGLGKVYGATRAVDDLSFKVDRGEILGLIGSNGAGKTTTLRCLAGILRPTAGSIRIAGADLATDPIAAKSITAFLPDEPKLFEYLTVKEHLNFVARLYAVTGWEEKAKALLEELELSGKESSLPGELSRGMKQKLLIACGFLRDPKLILLDEPLTGLDPVAIRRMKQSFERRAENGAAIVLSSHLLPLVEELCSRILVIAFGRKAAEGSLEQIRAGLDPMTGGRPVVSLEDVFVKVTKAREPET